MQIHVERGKNGFGFTVVDEFPVKVGRVDLGMDMIIIIVIVI